MRIARDMARTILLAEKGTIAMPMRKDMYIKGPGGQGGTWTMMTGRDLDEERPGPRGGISTTTRKRDLDHS